MEKEHMVHNLDTCPVCGEKYCPECHQTYNTLPDHDGRTIVFLEEHRCEKVKPKPTDTTRDLPKNKADGTTYGGAETLTPSSDKDTFIANGTEEVKHFDGVPKAKYIDKFDKRIYPKDLDIDPDAPSSDRGRTLSDIVTEKLCNGENPIEDIKESMRSDKDRLKELEGSVIASKVNYVDYKNPDSEQLRKLEDSFRSTFKADVSGYALYYIYPEGDTNIPNVADAVWNWILAHAKEIGGYGKRTV